MRRLDSASVIRPATIDDTRAIAEVHVASWRATYPGIVPQSYLDSLNVDERAARWRDSFAPASDMAIYVAEHDGAVCGFASGGPARVEFPGLAGELYAIYLLPEVQAKGIGAQLFSAIAGHLQKVGHTGMYVWVLEENRACGFYERIGGTRIQSAEIEIGGKMLIEVAYGWPDLAAER